METLNILKKTEVTVSNLPVIWGCIPIVIKIIGIVGILVAFCCSDDSSDVAKKLKYIVGVCVVLYIVFLVGTLTQKQIPTGRYTYEVEITDDTDITYIYENYEVISNNGRVWTIEDKESEE